MLYAVFCYHSEDIVGGWSKEQDDAVLGRLATVRKKLTDEGRLGPVARLMPTTAAVTVRAGDEPLVLDGPFAETKEQLLGFYLVDCANLDEAIAAAREMGRGECGAFEIRPLTLFRAGTAKIEAMEA